MKNTLTLLAFFMFAGIFVSCKDKLEEPRLEAGFSASVQTVKAGNPVTFSDESAGSASRWSWTFAGGSPATSDLSGPTVVYNQPGTYAVTLTLSNGKTSATVTKEAFITVSFNEVVANFEAGKTTIKQGESLSFRDLSSGLPTTWRWEFIPATGTPLVSTEQHPTITFSEPGRYTVKLTASNPEFSHSVTRSDYLEVVDITSVNAAFGSSQTGTYAGGSLSFTDQSVGTATAWSWTFEGGVPATSASRNPTVTYPNPGRYKVKLVASNSAKSSTVEKDGYVVVVPNSDLVAFYPFGGTADDAGPGQAHPTQIGTVSFAGTDRKGMAANAAQFDGSSGLLVPDKADFNFETNNYSVAFWVKTNKTSRMMIWQESGDQGSSTSQTWLRIGDNATTQRMRFNTEDATGGGFVNLGSEGMVADDAWHHVVCVREGQTSRVYIDGVRAKEGQIAALKDVSGNDGFKIGVQKGLPTTANPSGLSNFFTGLLDDVVIYKKALSAAEITALFNL
ncbi:MAG: PKD domain-containing protein [Adhaeribacter sp.]